MSEKGSETPGSAALVAMKDLEQDVVFKKPVVPRKRHKLKILDEDAYIEVSLLLFPLIFLLIQQVFSRAWRR